MAISFRRIALWTVAAAAVSVGAYFSFQEQPVPVDLAEVVSGPMEVTIDADGITRVRNVFDVSSPVNGSALRSPVHVGDEVLAYETVVAIIEPSQPAFLDARSQIQAEAAVKEAEAALRLSELNIAAVEASYDYANDQYERAKQLSEKGTLSSNALDEAYLLLEKARIALVSAQSEQSLRESTLERTKAMLIGPELHGIETPDSCCIEILAPVDGSILTVASQSERAVAAGSPLVRIGLLDDLELVVDLLSSDVVNLFEGAPAYVERWGGNETLLAEISKIEPSAVTAVSALGIAEQRVRVVLDFNSPEQEYASLGDGYRVFIRIVKWSDEEVLQFPISALFRSGESWMVFLVEDGIARAVPVEIGHRNSSAAEVLSGVSAGDIVITHPSDQITDGSKIVDRITQ